MRKVPFLFVPIAVFALSVATLSQDFMPGQIMIDVKHQYLPISPTQNERGLIETGLSSIDSLNGLYSVHAFEKLADDSWNATKGFYLLGFPDSLDAAEVVSSYSSDIHIHLAGLNGIRKPYGVIPRDYYFPQQWGLTKMNCRLAWRYTSGTPGITIQIIDGGTAYGHPDLVHNIWQNLGEDADSDGHTIEWYPVYPNLNMWVLDPGDVNSLDDDDNGYSDDLVGWDFVEWDGYPEYTTPHWGDHGTKTAGTAAAVTDNWLGGEDTIPVCDHQKETVAGTSWFGKIMIARFDGSDFPAIQALHYARKNGARIISMSWGSYSDFSPLHAVLDSAYEEGILLVAAAGEDGTATPVYPAAYSSVMAVATTDANDLKKSYSHYGTWVDICAPGENWSPSLLGEWYCYSQWEGTSCATLFVAGVAAMVWSCNLNASNAEVRAAVESTAVNIDGANPQYAGLLGSGRVNALMAVREFRPDPPPPGDANTDFNINVGDVVYLVTYIHKAGPPPDPWCVGDATDDGSVDVGDVVYLVNYLYHGGGAPLDGCD